MATRVASTVSVVIIAVPSHKTVSLTDERGFTVVASFIRSPLPSKFAAQCRRRAFQARTFMLFSLRRPKPLGRLHSMNVDRALHERLAAERASLIEPCLPSPSRQAPPSGLHWIHEIKHDAIGLGSARPPRVS
jgi:hypothetical protein